MYKPKWIMLEGPDRSGKSYQWYEIFKARDGVDTIMDRGVLASAYFHPPKQGIQQDIEMLKNWLQFDTSRLIIFVLSYKEQVKRVKNSNHEEVSFDAYQKEMDFYFKEGTVLQKEFPTKVLLVNADMDKENVTNTLLEFLSQDE